MRIDRVLKHRLQSLLHRSSAEQDLQHEIDIHFQQLIKEHMASGMSEGEARLAAKRDFGIIELTKERCRDTRRIAFLEDLKRDLVFALRALSKSPGFTATALLSLAIGIGANTAIYSFLDAILLRALPVPEPQQLVIFNWRCTEWPKVAHSQHGDMYTDSNGNRVSGTIPYPFFESLGDRDATLSSIFGFADANRLNLVVENQAFLTSGEYVSGNYFTGIGVRPALGRFISEEDDRLGSNSVAVISYKLWQTRFAAARSTIGQHILINRKPFTVAGVASPGFAGVNPRDSPDIFLPLHSLLSVDLRAQEDKAYGTQDEYWFHSHNNYWVEIMGRLRPGVTLHQAELATAQQFHSFVADSADTSR